MLQLILFNVYITVRYGTTRSFTFSHSGIQIGKTRYRKCYSSKSEKSSTYCYSSIFIRLMVQEKSEKLKRDAQLFKSTDNIFKIVNINTTAFHSHHFPLYPPPPPNPPPFPLNPLPPFEYPPPAICPFIPPPLLPKPPIDPFP